MTKYKKYSIAKSWPPSHHKRIFFVVLKYNLSSVGVLSLTKINYVLINL